MTERGVQVARLGEIESFADAERPTWRRVRGHFGIQAFGVNAWEATSAGQQLIGEHDELGEGAAGHEELYVVISGRATFSVDGATIDAPAVTLVFVPDPASKRAAVADEEGTTVLVVGAKAGEAFAISPWERVSEALRYWPTEEWDKAIELLTQQIAEQPDSAGAVYNLACAEARSGHGDAALEHLSRAVELEPRFRALAQDDADLVSIRDDPRFPEAEA